MKLPRRWGGALLLLIVVLALFAYRHARAVWSNPASPDLAAMPEAEFADNPALRMPPEVTELPYTLTGESFLQLLATYSPPEYLLWEVMTTVHLDGRTRSQWGSYLRQGNDSICEVTAYGSTVKRVDKKDGIVTLTLPQGSMEVPDNGNVQPTAVMGMANISDMALLRPQDIKEARFDLLDGRQVIYVEFTYPEQLVTERYWVSTQFGLPLQVESRLGDQLIYSATTLTLKDAPPAPPDQPPVSPGGA